MPKSAPKAHDHQVDPAELSAAAVEAIKHLRIAGRLLSAASSDEGGLSLMEAARRLVLGDATGIRDLGCRMGPFWLAGYDELGTFVWIGWHHLCVKVAGGVLYGVTIHSTEACLYCGQVPPPMPEVPEATRAAMLQGMGR